MVALLALAFLAAALSGGKDYSIAGTAEWLFYAIVVVWGTRNAATAVVGEIRDRTWDMQLLSSIAPGAMMWGKLFGSTIYNWFGGAICLCVLLSDTFVHKGGPQAAIDLVYYIAIGVISQAASFLASLVAVRRRQAHSRLDVFIYQVVGLLAGVAVYSVWSIADPAGSILTHKPPSDFVIWWGGGLRHARVPPRLARDLHCLDAHRLLSRDASGAEDAQRGRWCGSPSWSSSASMSPGSTRGWRTTRVSWASMRCRCGSASRRRAMAC